MIPPRATSPPSRGPRTRIKPFAPEWTCLDLDVTRFRRGIAQANARRLRLVGYRHTHPQGVARLPGAAIAGFGYLRQGAAIARLPSSRATAIIPPVPALGRFGRGGPLGAAHCGIREGADPASAFDALESHGIL